VIVRRGKDCIEGRQPGQVEFLRAWEGDCPNFPCGKIGTVPCVLTRLFQRAASSAGTGKHALARLDDVSLPVLDCRLLAVPGFESEGIAETTDVG